MGLKYNYVTCEEARVLYHSGYPQDDATHYWRYVCQDENSHWILLPAEDVIHDWTISKHAAPTHEEVVFWKLQGNPKKQLTAGFYYAHTILF